MKKKQLRLADHGTKQCLHFANHLHSLILMLMKYAFELGCCPWAASYEATLTPVMCGAMM